MSREGQSQNVERSMTNDGDQRSSGSSTATPARFIGWRRRSSAPISGRVGAFGAWTGSRFLVWGGYERIGDVETPTLDGALFDPVSGRWEPIPAAPLDRSSAGTSATWTDSELVVFSADMKSGAAFNVGTGRWRTIEPPPLDAGGTNVPGLVWTGTELFVLAAPVDDVDTSMAWAAAWNPATDRWRPLPEPGFRSMQSGPVVWTGKEIAVLHDANRAFDPAKEQWRSLDNAGGAVAGLVWTGQYTIAHGTAYEPATQTCRNLPLEPERPGGGYREFGVDVWTGSEFIRWSGANGGDGAPRANDGVAFKPAAEPQP